jgi:hypothetical protein
MMRIMSTGGSTNKLLNEAMMLRRKRSLTGPFFVALNARSIQFTLCSTENSLTVSGNNCKLFGCSAEDRRQHRRATGAGAAEHLDKTKTFLEALQALLTGGSPATPATTSLPTSLNASQNWR